MNNYFKLIDTVLYTVFLDLNNPFTYIFCGFFVLGLIICIIYLIFGDR